MDLREGRVEAGGLGFGVLEAGDAGAPLVLCLHGFPDSRWTWRHLLPQLAEAGYHAVAPAMRGYAPTDVPADGRYQTGALVLDALALHEALGGDGDAVLIGHDWGAMAAYGAASFAPDRWRRVVTMAVPPAGAVAQGFVAYRQLKRSWYMFFFQHGLADVVVGADDLGFLDRLWQDWSPSYDASDDLPRVKEALGSPERLAAALAYYRATLGGVGVDPALAEVQAACSAPTPQPTLYLHGSDDGCVGVEVADGSLAFLGEGSEVAIVEATGHFLHLESPDEVGARVVEFVGRS